MDTIRLDGRSLTLEMLHEVAVHRKPIEIDPAGLERAIQGRQVLFDMAAAGEPVYGLNRGVGWDKDKEFSQDFFEAFNRNLLHSHSVGMAPYNSIEEVRAIMLIRLNRALNGHTGISKEILELYRDYLNLGIHPRIPRRGSIGEGDIATLSHIGLAFIGEEDVEFEGRIENSKVVMERLGLPLAVLGPKDGLSILSSNAQGEGMAYMMAVKARGLMRLANLVGALCLEGLNGVIDPFTEAVNEVRHLKGQQACGAEIRHALRGSYLYEPYEGRPLQDPLCFRCMHAIHGAVYDGLTYIEELIGLQINATDDNPCIILEEGRTYGSANFETISLAVGVEMLAIALSHVSKASTYRMIKMMGPHFTGLTRQLTPEEVRYIGFGTVQKATATLDTEIRHLATPSSMDFFPSEGDIEDHASNLPLAVSKVNDILDKLTYLFAIEIMHACQAVDLRGVTKLGLQTGELYRAYREIVPFYGEDRNISRDIKISYDFLRSLLEAEVKRR